MHLIESDNVNDFFVKVSKALVKDGKEVSPRGLKTIELEDVWGVISDVNDPVVSLPARKLSKEYLEAEFQWYLSGDLSIEKIKDYSSFWKTLVNSNGTVNSNYGHLALKRTFNGKSQLEWCIDRIKEDPFTRKAIINYNLPEHKYEGNKDFVCTMFQSFRQVDKKINSKVFMRSNDLIYGLSYDLPWFVHLQKEVAKATNFSLGKYEHYAGSLHVYERYWDMLREMAKG